MKRKRKSQRISKSRILNHKEMMICHFLSNKNMLKKINQIKNKRRAILNNKKLSKRVRLVASQIDGSRSMDQERRKLHNF